MRVGRRRCCSRSAARCFELGGEVGGCGGLLGSLELLRRRPVVAAIGLLQRRVDEPEVHVERGGGVGRFSFFGQPQPPLVAESTFFTGDIIDATEAHRIGLVGRIVEPDQLLDTSLERAHVIAANPPLAIAHLKAALRDTLDPDWRELGRWVSSTLGELFQTDDHKEGVASFLEKRPPHFTGK